MKQNSTSCTEYIRLWEAGDETILKHGDTSKTRQSLLRTMESTLDCLSNSAKELLRTSAHLDPTRIWLRMFRDHPVALFRPVELGNAVKQIEAVSIGAQLSGMDVHGRYDAITIHPVMHKVMRLLDSHLYVDVQNKYFNAALSMVIGSAGPLESQDFPANLEKVSLHVIQCHADFSRYCPNVNGERSRHFAKLAKLMHELAKIEMAKDSPESLDAAAAWFEKTRSAFQQLGSPGGFDLARDETRLEASRYLKKCCSADELGESLHRIYELQRTDDGPLHLRTIGLLANHGENMLQATGKEGLAHRWLSKAYERYRQSPRDMSSSEKSKMYSCLGYLGIACGMLGRDEEAVRYLSEARVYFSDKDRSKALDYAARIPRIYSHTGRLPEERDALKKVLEFSELSQKRRIRISSRLDEVERSLRAGPYQR
jgi:hypothetical protein